mmetsp:Transcript_36383/g.75728  ORF Transcript_36383/g.75728 Transcript_36383/m.75728 type:complete len:111 (-) Transcript_36383:119-451(-)
MASFNDTRRRLFRLYPHLEAAVDKVQREVFGAYPKGAADHGGYYWNRKQPKGVYLNQHYGEDIMKHAHKFEKGLLTEQQQRRQEKLVMLRRKGMGPPKKGAGKRATKNKK